MAETLESYERSSTFDLLGWSMSVVAEVEHCSSGGQVESVRSRSEVVLGRLEGGDVFPEVGEWECEIDQVVSVGCVVDLG